MKQLQRSRNYAMDIIRCIALFCVVSVHFFLNTGFYDEAVTGFRMYIMVLLRTSFMVCVPLFIVLSGHLMGSKKPNKSYYVKIVKTISIYAMASLACVLYRNLEGSNPVSIKIAILELFSYHAAPYAWYVEMYIGLFLLIPFVNVLYSSLETKQAKTLFIATLLILTALPSITNIWCIFNLHWWVQPSSSPDYYKIVPAWWTKIYPITYYCIGCYLREYPLRIKRSANVLLIIATTVLAGTFCYYRSYGAPFVGGAWEDYSSAITTVQTVLLFHYLAGIKCDKLSERKKLWLSHVSDWCFGAYLVSWIFDQVFYKLLNMYQPIVQKRIDYFILIVPTIYICSLALSACITTGYDLLVKKLIKNGIQKNSVHSE